MITTIISHEIHRCGLHNLNKEIAEKHPAQTLELLHTILSAEITGWPYFMGETLQKIYDSDAVDKSEERLLELRRKWNAR